MFLPVPDQAAIVIAYRQFIEGESTIEDHVKDYGYPDEIDARTSLAFGELLNKTTFKNFSNSELKNLI